MVTELTNAANFKSADTWWRCISGRLITPDKHTSVILLSTHTNNVTHKQRRDYSLNALIIHSPAKCFPSTVSYDTSFWQQKMMIVMSSVNHIISKIFVDDEIYSKCISQRWWWQQKTNICKCDKNLTGHKHLTESTTYEITVWILYATGIN